MNSTYKKLLIWNDRKVGIVDIDLPKCLCRSGPVLLLWIQTSGRAKLRYGFKKQIREIWEHVHCPSDQSCFSSPDKSKRCLKALLMLFVQRLLSVYAGYYWRIFLQRLKLLAGLSQGNFTTEQMGADSDNLHLAVHSRLLPHVQGKATVKPKANSSSK